MSDQEALNHLRNGNLVAFAETLDADERVEYDSTGAMGRGIHLRYGGTDILVQADGTHKITGEVIYKLSAHGHHGSVSDAIECYRSNVEKNLRLDREYLIDPARAGARAAARAVGMPEELIDRMIPMPELDEPAEDPEQVVAAFRGQLDDMPSAPVSGGPVGWWGGQ